MSALVLRFKEKLYKIVKAVFDYVTDVCIYFITVHVCSLN